MAELIAGITAERVRANLARVREEIVLAAKEAGRDPSEVHVLAATKYVAISDLPALAEAGIWLVGENRAQDLAEKVAAQGDRFAWHFIGQLQSRRVPAIVPHARLIHSLASESALHALERHRQQARPGMEVLCRSTSPARTARPGCCPRSCRSMWSAPRFVSPG